MSKTWMSLASSAASTATRANARAPVKLHHLQIPACQPTVAAIPLSPVVFIHGLVASESTYRSILKRPDFVPQREKIGIDLCNHGASPRVAADDMDYDTMSADLLHLLDELRIERAVLVGHSMGGKVAMHTALKHEDRVDKLVVVDIAPIAYRPNSRDPTDSSVVLRLMSQVDAECLATGAVSSRADVERALMENGMESEMLRRFLITNLRNVAPAQTVEEQETGVTQQKRKYRWKTNVDEVARAMPKLLAFPPHVGNPCKTPTCFIRGGKSKYVPFQAMKPAVQLFPRLKLVTISDAGHWLQAQMPDQFCESVNQFIGD